MEVAFGLGADFVATGHYCRKSFDGTNFHLLAGKDSNKDQSYFLCQLNQDQLSKALFPIGEMQKSEVRAIAKEANLITAEKKDSQGLCFIGKVKLPDFLKQKLEAKTGDVIEISTYSKKYINHQKNDGTIPYSYTPKDGQKLGEHKGAHFYTIGQRKGLGIGGTKLPLFIIGLNTETNTVYVGQGEDHPGLNRKGLKIKSDEFHLVNPEFSLEIGEKKECLARIRYRQPLQKCKLERKEYFYIVHFAEYQKGVTPGQFCAFYLDDDLVASGIINA